MSTVFPGSFLERNLLIILTLAKSILNIFHTLSKTEPSNRHQSHFPNYLKPKATTVAINKNVLNKLVQGHFPEKRVPNGHFCLFFLKTCETSFELHVPLHCLCLNFNSHI